MAKGLAFLGLQDAARKRRMPSQTLGSWTGATVSLDGIVVQKGVTKERWEKVKSKIRCIANEIGLSDDLPQIPLESCQKLQKKMEGPRKESCILKLQNPVWAFWFMCQ